MVEDALRTADEPLGSTSNGSSRISHLFTERVVSRPASYLPMIAAMVRLGDEAHRIATNPKSIPDTEQLRTRVSKFHHYAEQYIAGNETSLDALIQSISEFKQYRDTLLNESPMNKTALALANNLGPAIGEFEKACGNYRAVPHKAHSNGTHTNGLY